MVLLILKRNKINQKRFIFLYLMKYDKINLVRIWDFILKKYLDSLFLFYAFVQGDWYFTDDYIYSIRSFQKIDYKDIIVVEGGFTRHGNGMNNLGWKQKLYLRNGENYQLKFAFDDDAKLRECKELLLSKNSDIYFGIIEDYQIKKQERSVR